MLINHLKYSAFSFTVQVIGYSISEKSIQFTLFYSRFLYFKHSIHSPLDLSTAQTFFPNSAG